MRRDAQFHTYKRRDLTWQNQAACLGVMDYCDETQSDAYRKSFCNNCSVINECLEYALNMANAELQHKGIFYGGHSGHDIAKFKRDMREGRAA